MHAQELTAHPMVEYLNSLRTQEHGANPSYVYENRKAFVDRLRALSPWFPEDQALYVRTQLDEFVDDVARDRVATDLIFLTGDAGDGKTALCAQIARRLGREAELADVTAVGDWLIIKDASEVEEERLRDLLSTRLAQAAGVPRLLVAINEGRLRRVMRNGFAIRPGLWDDVIEPALEAWLDDSSAQVLDERMRAARVMVVNFRHRFHVPTVVPKLLTAWTRPGLWEQSSICPRCDARSRCPILANSASLRSSVSQNNFSDVLTSAHFAGQRLPFRRLQAVLAMAVTAGLKCRDVQTGALASESLSPIDLLRYRYYEALFRSDSSGPVSVQPEAVTRSLAPADPGLAASHAFDQQVTEAATPIGGAASPGSLLLCGVPLPPFEENAVRFVHGLITPREDAREVADLTAALARLTQALRRWAGVSIEKVDASEPWRQALRQLQRYAEGGDSEPLLRLVVGALNRLHNVETLKEDAIARRQIDPGGFRDPARLALELDIGVDFEVRLACGPVLPALVSGWLESAASEIYLEARPKGRGGDWARLHLNSRLVEALLGTRAGFTYLGTLGPYRRDLARFHGRLLAIARDQGQVPQITLRVGEGRYRATSTSPMDGKPARLRFDGEA